MVYCMKIVLFLDFRLFLIFHNFIMVWTFYVNYTHSLGYNHENEINGLHDNFVGPLKICQITFSIDCIKLTAPPH